MPHTRAAILSIGDELTLGQALDTNSRWLADRLMALGIPTVEHVTVGDDVAQHTDALRRLCVIAPLIISTGGLGPTLDDLTRDALAAVMGEPLVTDEETLAALERRFAARNRPFTDAQRTQALRPRSATCLRNPNGTAPGLHASFAACDVFCLPGPPGEMKPMFETSVVPLLRPPAGRVVRTRFLQVIGIGEGDAAGAVGSLMDRDRNPLVGITASGAQLTWRIRYEGTDEATADAQLAETEAVIRAALGPHVFGSGETTLARAVIDKLASACGGRGRTLGVVESCTGGMLGGLITAESGSSAVFMGGLITYSNDLKTSLAHVAPPVLDDRGAVSREVAMSMAEGGCERLGVDECIAITGIAGPGGGSAEKPVGTVWIAITTRDPGNEVGLHHRTVSRRFIFPGDRDEVRLRAARTALGMLWLSLNTALDGRRLLFEQT